MKISVRQVVEIPFNLPNGVENHPAIIISTNNALEEESHEFFVAVMTTHNTIDDDFTFELNASMFVGNKVPSSNQVRLHLVSSFTTEDIITNNYPNVFMKEEYFKRMMKQIIEKTFGFNIK